MKASVSDNVIFLHYTKLPKHDGITFTELMFMIYCNDWVSVKWYFAIIFTTWIHFSFSHRSMKWVIKKSKKMKLLIRFKLSRKCFWHKVIIFLSEIFYLFLIIQTVICIIFCKSLESLSSKLEDKRNAIVWIYDF